MRKAWIDNERVRDICDGDPFDRMPAEIAALFDTDVSSDAAPGDGWVDGQLVKPEPVTLPPAPEPVVVPAKLSPVQFMLLLTSAERVAIKAARATDPVIDDWLDIIEDARLTEVDLGLASTQDALAYLVSINLLTNARKDAILAHRP